MQEACQCEWKLKHNKKFKGPHKRILYSYMMLQNDKWTKRNQPEWFNTYLIQSNKEKEILKEKIMDNVRNKLPEFSRKNRLTVRRFHSFLRVCYDNMF